MSHSMDQNDEKSINLKACRFCLKVTKTKISINGDIKTKFLKLMNEEMVDSPGLPQNCCKTCISEIEKCITVKEKIFENQNYLLNLASSGIKEEEPDDHVFEDSALKLVKTEIVDPDDENGEDSRVQMHTFDFDNYSSPSPQSNQSDEDFNIDEDLPTKSNDRLEKMEKIGHKCDFCGNILSSKYRLKYHIRKLHPQTREEYQKREEEKANRHKTKCKDCGVELYKFRLLAHQISHHGIESTEYYSCDICGARRINKHGIIGHMQRIHRGRKTWACEICSKVLKSKQNLDEHRKQVHNFVITDVCEVCGAKFKNQKSYTLHVRAVHTHETPYKCEFCEKSFHLQSSLCAHVRNLHNSKPEVCQYCAKIFKNLRNLKSHIEFCHTERDKPCFYEGCDFKYSSKKKLQLHIYKRHTDLKKFVCNVCDTGYRGRDGLQNHIYSIHMNWKINCLVPGCTSTFHRKDYLRTHLKKYHKDRGPFELQRLVNEAQAVKLPSIKEYYTTISNQKPSYKTGILTN